MKLRAGDLVEVRSREEILASLDKRGRLEGLPVMPQMFTYCGQQFRVYKRAHKTCDTLHYYRGGGRQLTDSVHLELRCDGEAYGGCQAACLIFWKEAWLKPVREGFASEQTPGALGGRGDRPATVVGCTEAEVRAGTTAESVTVDDPTYVCQSTLLPEFTSYLPWWDMRQYLEDYSSGNIDLVTLFNGLVYDAYSRLAKPFVRTAQRMHGLYDGFQALRGGIPYPRRTGSIPVGQPTPTCTLDLQPGEMVRVKSYQEILATLNTNGENRGMKFDAEMVPYCGGTYRVRSRVDKFISERTGKMTIMKTPAIILENVWCRSRYSDCRMFCPRSIYSWWREVWLERTNS